MKKVLYLITLLLIITGCSISLSDIDNTPTKKVEIFFNNYQTLDKKVLDNLDLVVAKETTYTDKQKEKYRDIIKKHYRNLNYDIKEETINGNSAVVEAEIEITDFNKVLNSNKVKQKEDFYNEEGAYDELSYNEYRLNLLEEAKEKIKYTLYLSLTKEDNEWILNDLTDEDEQKILGIYHDNV